MIGKESMKYSLKNLVSRKNRSLLTIISIFIGITTIFVFVSFGWGLYDYIDALSSSSSADKVIIQSKTSAMSALDTAFALTDDDLDEVRGTSGVYEATGVYIKAAEVSFRDKKTYTLLTGYDPDKPLMMEVFGNIGLEEGRWLKSGDKNAIILGYNYRIADKIFPTPVTINDEVEVNGEDFRVAGFLERIGSPPDDAQIYISDSRMEELYSDETLSYNWIIARVDMKNIDEVIDRIERNLRKARGLEEGKEDFFVQSFDDLIEGYSTALDVVIGFVILIALISVIVSAINTANTMVTSVLERTKEIGVLKSIGSKNSEIFKIFLFESGFLGFVAGVIGVCVGFILTSIGAAILTNLGWSFLQPHYSFYLFAGCILFATLTGAISGVFPAINAARTSPVEALRYE